MLEGKKTFILSMLYAAAALAEVVGVLDFPFITDPWEHIQLAITAILLRIGIGKPVQE